MKTRSMTKRIDHVLKRAKATGMFSKCGDHYHFGEATMERFDIETVVEGESPALLPLQDEPTDKLTLADVRGLVRATLESLDREKAGLPEPSMDQQIAKLTKRD